MQSASANRRANLGRALALIAVLALFAAGCGGGELQDGVAPDPAWLDASDGGGASDSGSGADGAAVADGGGDGGGGDDAGGLDGDSDDVGAGGDVDGANADATVEEQHFAAWLTSTVMVQDPTPFGSSWEKQTTTTLALVKVRWTGAKGERWVQPCALHTTPAFGSQLTYPTSFLAAVPVLPAPIERDGASWTQAEVVERVGLKAGYDGAMPADGDGGHAALVDADADGKPGVTLGVEIPIFGAQKLYVAQRAATAWQGEVDGEGVLRAEPTIASEQSIVGATLELLVTSPKQKPVSDGPAHTLRWHPLDAPIGCAMLVNEAKARVGASWPP
jgi:hypothetical protein